MTVWCAISIKQVIGPYYFAHSIVNEDGYLSSLNNVFFPLLPGLPPDTHFQQNGAPPHYRVAVRQVLDDKFPGSWIGRGVFIP